MSVDFDQIIGHERQLKYLQGVIKNNNVGHAYCFSGPSSIGKYTIARQFVAQILNYPESKLEIHVNASIIDGEKISVDLIRELLERLSLSTLGGGEKIVIINNAHTMSINAQNALLKTLEEPKGKTVIILVTEKPEFLLQTILSRSAHIRFNLVGKSELASSPLAKGGLRGVVDLCAGRPGLAIKLTDEKYKDQFLEIAGEAKKFLKMSLAGRLTFIESVVKQKDERNDKIKELISLWRVLVHNQLMESLTSSDTSKSSNPKTYAHALRALQETQEALERNSNKSLALQHFALSF